MSLENAILDLQRAAGNAAVASLFSLQRGPASEASTATKPTAAAAGAATGHAGEAVLLEKVASGGRRDLDAVALVPPAVAASPSGAVSVLLHLHGISTIAGHHYDQMLRKGEIPPEYDMTAQLESATAKPGSRMIALLPIGKTVPVGGGKFTVDFGGFDTDALATETIARLVKTGRLPAGATAGGVILSAHSGGGFDAKAAASGKKVAGMFAFESIHNDLDQYQALLAGKLDDDLREIQSLAPHQKTDAAAAEVAYQAQAQYLRERGFRFVGFAGSNKGYRERFRELDKSIHGPSGWIAKHDSALRQASGSHFAEIRQMLAGNYQFNVEESGDHFKVVAQGHLQQALASLGTVPGSRQAPLIHAEKPSAPKAAATAKPTAKLAAPLAGAPTKVTITFGPHARQDAVAASSMAILTDVLRAAGLSKATITSTARTAADQARAMYQNLVSVGIDAQRELYGPGGNLVIDTFEALEAEGKSPKEIEDGMRDRIVEIGPSKVSRHCGDFHVLNVFDVGPYSLGGAKARKAFAEAAKAEVGKRVSKFIPWPKDPGDHFEIKPASASGAGPAPPQSAAPAAPKPAPEKTAVPEKARSVKAPVAAKPAVPSVAGVTAPKAPLSTKWKASSATSEYELNESDRTTLAATTASERKTDREAWEKGKRTWTALEAKKKRKKSVLTAAETSQLETLTQLRARVLASNVALGKSDVEQIVEKAFPGQTVAWWYSQIKSGSLLGIPLRVHQALAERFDQAEAALLADPLVNPRSLDAVALGKTLGMYASTSDLRSPMLAVGGSSLSMHSFGLAVDLNYKGNPFIGNAGKAAPDAIKRATSLVNNEPIDVLKSGGYATLKKASDALVTYFSYRDAANMPELKEKVQHHASADGEPVNVDDWLTQINKDYAELKDKGDFASHKDPAQGFLDFNEAVVAKLIGAGLTWGGTYPGAKDMMHFDLREGDGAKIDKARKAHKNNQ